MSILNTAYIIKSGTLFLSKLLYSSKGAKKYDKDELELLLLPYDRTKLTLLYADVTKKRPFLWK